MQMVRKVALGVRRRKWLLLVVLIVGVGALTNRKPQWYLDEAAVMEQVARLLDSPVPYERGGEGWLGAHHVSRVFLPRGELDKEKTRRLASLLRKLPRDTAIVCHYVRDQEDRIEQLRSELAGHAPVFLGPGASSKDIETRQRQTHVAGIHRPDVLGSNR